MPEPLVTAVVLGAIVWMFVLSSATFAGLAGRMVSPRIYDPERQNPRDRPPKIQLLFTGFMSVVFFLPAVLETADSIARLLGLVKPIVVVPAYSFIFAFIVFGVDVAWVAHLARLPSRDARRP